MDASAPSPKLHPVPLSLREANDFVQAFHRHSARTSRDGGKFAVGVSDGERLWGIAIVGNPVSATLMDGTTGEVLRVCVEDGAPKGSNSFLYGCCWRAWRAMGGQKLITYTLQSESGASLRGAGWRVVGEVAPHNRWTTRKDHLQREWQSIYGQAKFRWEVADPLSGRALEARIAGGMINTGEGNEPSKHPVRSRGFR